MLQRSKKARTDRPMGEEIISEVNVNGFIVIPSVISFEECDDIVDKGWTFLESLDTQLNRHNNATWIDENRPMHHRGFIFGVNIAFQTFFVIARMAVMYVFVAIWGADKLWTSLDGCIISKKPKHAKFESFEDWKEKTWTKDEFVIMLPPAIHDNEYLGALFVTTSEINERCFVYFPGSHRLFTEMLALEPKLRKTRSGPERKLNPEHLDFFRSKGIEPVRVPVRRGSMIIWDPTLVHCSSEGFRDAPSDSMHFELRISMSPWNKGSEKTHLMSARRMFEKGRTTHAFAHPLRLRRERGTFGNKCYRGSDEPHVSPPITDMKARRLHGLLGYLEEEEE